MWPIVHSQFELLTASKFLVLNLNDVLKAVIGCCPGMADILDKISSSFYQLDRQNKVSSSYTWPHIATLMKQVTLRKHAHTIYCNISRLLN